MRKELEEAAREGGSRGSIGSTGSAEEKILESMPYYTALPTKVALRFVSSYTITWLYFWNFWRRTIPSYIILA